MAESTTVTSAGAPLATDGTVEILHPEKVRGDLGVPPDLR